jgi:hypothetical protein
MAGMERFKISRRAADTAMTEKNSFEVHLDPSRAAFVRKFAARRGIPVSETLRRIIERAIDAELTKEIKSHLAKKRAARD